MLFLYVKAYEVWSREMRFKVYSDKKGLRTVNFILKFILSLYGEMLYLTCLIYIIQIVHFIFSNSNILWPHVVCNMKIFLLFFTESYFVLSYCNLFCIYKMTGYISSKHMNMTLQNPCSNKRSLNFRNHLIRKQTLLIKCYNTIYLKQTNKT